MQQNNKTQSELKTGTIHKYFDRNILTLTMSNATKKNAINYEMYAALSQALDQAATNQDIHVVVLTGEDSHLPAAMMSTHLKNEIPPVPNHPLRLFS